MAVRAGLAVAAPVAVLAAATGPASAATVNVTIDCLGPVSVSANPGDQIVLEMTSDCPAYGVDGHFGGFVKSLPTWGFGFLDLDSAANYDVDHSQLWFWQVQSDGSGTTTATTTLLASNSVADLSTGETIGYAGISGLTEFYITYAGTRAAEAEPDLGLPDVLQQLPMPATGSCADMGPEAALWAVDSPGGWSRSWAEWANGPVCTRTLHYDTSSRAWVAVP